MNFVVSWVSDMFTHVWTATNVDYDNASGRVSHVHYMLETTDVHSHKTKSYGTVRLIGSSSIPIDNVTKELAISWAKRELGKESTSLKEKMNEDVLKHCDQVSNKAPWDVTIN